MEALLFSFKGVFMEVNEVFEKVKNLFVEELGIDEDKISMESKLVMLKLNVPKVSILRK